MIDTESMRANAAFKDLLKRATAKGALYIDGSYCPNCGYTMPLKTFCPNCLKAMPEIKK